MTLSGNTILVTGGSAGIGLELARQLQQLGNTVLITGRDPAKLQRAIEQNPQLHAIQSDASDPEAIASLRQRVTRDFPAFNLLINNAGVMRKLNLTAPNPNLGAEIDIDLLGPIRLIEAFLPHLLAQPAAAIVNVTSGIAFVPYPISPIYSAAKAGLHAFTRALRVQLRGTRVRVVELAPPSVDTALNGAFTPADLKGVPMLTPEKVATALIQGLRRDRTLILPGLSKVFHLGGRLAPNLMLRAASTSVKTMLAEVQP